MIPISYILHRAGCFKPFEPCSMMMMMMMMRLRMTMTMTTMMCRCRCCCRGGGGGGGYADAFCQGFKTSFGRWMMMSQGR